MTKKIGNFDEGIHKVDYLTAYLQKQIKDSDIMTGTREVESLNGEWRYAVDQYDSCLRQKLYEEKRFDAHNRALPEFIDFDNLPTMTVPSVWNTQDEKLFLYEGSVIYTRKFTYEAHGEDRVFIKFGAANYRASVFVNQKFFGTHLGGSTPFSVEVTGSLKRFNRLLVVVNNTRTPAHVPMDNTDWFNYGGLYRDVALVRLSTNFIRSYKIGLVPASGFKQISVSVKFDQAENGTVTVKIPELEISETLDVIDGEGSLILQAAPELWSPDHPKLYDVMLKFGTEVLTDKVGFREISVSNQELLLNGKSIFLRGISAHEESLLNGKAVTEAEIRENYALVKEMNGNFMRLAHYPHTALAARIADEVGILLWEEVPVYWAIQFDDPETYMDAQNQLTELIKRDQNRASVIIWSVGNENADTQARFKFMSALVDRAHMLDATRLVSAACLYDKNELVINDRLAAKVDVIGINEYCGWYEPDFGILPRLFANSHPDKPVIITEFGADAKAGNHGSQDEMFTEENQLAIYKKQIETLRKIDYVKGMTPWILYDFRCPRRMHTMQNYYNLKGLLSADKKHRKLAFYAMQEFYDEKK